MTSTQSSTPPASTTVRELIDDTIPVLDTVYVAGPPLFLAWAGTVLIALMLAGPFALLVTLVAVAVAAAAVVALAAAILASPYLLVRHIRRHREAHAATRTAPQFAPVASHGAAA